MARGKSRESDRTEHTTLLAASAGVILETIDTVARWLDGIANWLVSEQSVPKR